MAHAGDTIENPVDGQRIMFVRTVEDSGGDELAIELFTPPGTSAVPAHLHLAAEETYEVLAGTLGVWVGSKRQRRTVGPGGRVALPPRVAHQHWNAGPDLLHVVNTFRPAGNLELGLQATFGLARDGKAGKDGRPKSLLDTMLILELLGIVPAGLPVPLGRALVRGAAATARRLGRQEHYPQYTRLATTLVPVP